MIKSIKNPPESDVLKVILDDDIYDRITEDSDPKREELGAPDLSGWKIIGGYVDGKIASLFMVENGQLHFYCIKESRGHARELLQCALALHKKTVFCEIPTLYMGVINFAKKAGFKTVKIKTKSWLKNGQLYNVEVLKWAR